MDRHQQRVHEKQVREDFSFSKAFSRNRTGRSAATYLAIQAAVVLVLILVLVARSL